MQMDRVDGEKDGECTTSNSLDASQAPSYTVVLSALTSLVLQTHLAHLGIAAAYSQKESRDTSLPWFAYVGVQKKPFC